jgi:hypothetical protein
VTSALSAAYKRRMKAMLVVAVLAALGFAVTGCGAVSKTSPPTGAMQHGSHRHLVGASGLVVAKDGTARFCGGAVAVDLGGSSVPPCSGGLLLSGVDLSRLSQRVQRDGSTWGYAYLAGTFSRGTLTVVRQGSTRPAPNPGPAWRRPPCPAPAGGWPAIGPDSSNPGVPHLADVLDVTIFRPRTGVAVITIASSNPARTRRSAGGSAADLCIVRSRYSARELARTRNRLLEILSSGTPSARDYLTGVGSTSSATGQPAVAVQALVDTPALDTFVRSAPHGIIALDLWLRPVRTG